MALSRPLIEAALRDLEAHGETFPQLDDFRSERGVIDPAIIPGAYRKLTDYLHRSGVPVGLPNSRITVVDDGWKGSSQEGKAAMYPETDFTGRYAFFRGHPSDPHPGTKHGYALHWEAKDDPRYRKLTPQQHAKIMGDRRNVDPMVTFFLPGNRILEDVLHGPFDSASRLGDTGPRRLRHQGTPMHTLYARLNPALIEERYRDPGVREGTKASGLFAVHDEALCLRDGHVAAGDLERRSAQFIEDCHAYNQHRPLRDRRLQRFLRNFASRPPEDSLNKRVSEALDAANVTLREAMPTWEKLASFADFEKAQEFAGRVISNLQQRSPAMAAPEVALKGFPPEVGLRARSPDNLAPPPPTRRTGREPDGPWIH